MKRLFYFSIIFFYSNNILSAQPDTTFILFLNKIFNNNETKDSVFSFTNFQNIIQNNELNNVGLEINREINLDSFNEFTSSQFVRKKNNYFFSEIPVVKAKYLLGSNNEQIFNINHSQFFLNRIGYTINYERVRSEGFYKHQLVEIDRFDGGVFINSKKNNFLTGITYNSFKINREENGGILFDSLFELGNFINNKLHEVNLMEAINNQLNNKCGIVTKILIGKNKKSFLLNEFYFSKSSRNYIDNPNSNFYSSIYHDSLITNDVFQYSTFANELGAKFDFQNKGNLFLSLKINEQKYSDNYFDTNTVNLSLQTKFHYKLSKNSIIELEGKYFLSGYNLNDFYINNSIIINSKNHEQTLKINLFTKNQKPFINNLVYNSNNFVWNNNFDDQISIIPSIIYCNENYKFDLMVEYAVNEKIIYYNSFSRPEQYDGSLSSFKLKLNKTFKYNNWGLDNKFIYQFVSNKDLIRVPEFISHNSIYFKSKMWSMEYKTGINLFYFTSYFSNAYSPALQAFYIQNEKRIGNYPYFGIFFEGKIKAVNLYFSIQHINEGLQKRTYYSTIHYPMNDRTFQFGISWEFKD